MATAEQTSSLGERVSRIEGGYEHLATKADLAQMKAEFGESGGSFQAELRLRNTSSLGERVSRIEGGYEHLATKAAQMKAELTLRR